MNKAYKFRIYPNLEQKLMFSKTFDCSRLVYNYYLNKKIQIYNADKSSFSYVSCAKDDIVNITLHILLEKIE